MIKSLKIKNIQSHKNTLIEFDKGVNMVIGGSDKGKSAIFNALYWVVFNRPLGEQHRSWWKGTMLSKVEFFDNSFISLSRKQQNVYKIKTDKDVLEYKAFGQEPPKEVLDIFNIDRKINIQQQLERGVPIFLLSESPGDVARFFNKVANIDKIDSAIKTGKQETNKTERQLKQIDYMIEQKIAEIEEYDHIKPLMKLVDKALEFEETSEKINLDIFSLENELNNLDNNLAKLDLLKARFGVLCKVEKAVEINKRLQNINNEHVIISRGISEFEIITTKLNNKKQRRKILSKINDTKLLTKKINSIVGLKNQIEGLFSKQNSTLKQLEYLNTKKAQLAKKLKNSMPKECPLCGGKI